MMIKSPHLLIRRWGMIKADLFKVIPVMNLVDQKPGLFPPRLGVGRRLIQSLGS